jgi:hypothetical protein
MSEWNQQKFNDIVSARCDIPIFSGTSTLEPASKLT